MMKKKKPNSLSQVYILLCDERERGCDVLGSTSSSIWAIQQDRDRRYSNNNNRNNHIVV